MNTQADRIYEFIIMNSPCEERWVLHYFGDTFSVRETMRVFEQKEMIEYQVSLFGAIKLVAIVDGVKLDNSLDSVKKVIQGGIF